MPRAYTEQLQKGDKPVGTNVDIIARDYETVCPKCKTLCILIEVPCDGEGVTYENNAVQVHLLQAQFGDLDGNRQVNILDIFKIKTSDHGFGKPGPATWADGDCVGSSPNSSPNGVVNIFDIFAIKGAGSFGQGPYATGDEMVAPGVEALGADAMAKLIYDAATGELFLDNEAGVESMVLESADGLFEGEADASIASFVELNTGVFGAVSFDGPLPTGSLGLVLPSGLDESTLAADLSLRGSVELVYKAVPEPGTLAMLAMGLMGLIVWRRRQTRP